MGLTLEKDLSLGVDEETYNFATSQILELNEIIADSEREGIEVIPAGRSRNDVGKNFVMSKSVNDDELLRPWYEG